MDKAKFVESAPRYYALAIAWHLLRNNRSSKPNIVQEYRQKDGTSLLPYSALFEAASKWLVSEGMLDLDNDDFGPSLYSAAPGIGDGWNRLIKDKTTPFYKFDLTGTDMSWLREALFNVNKAYKDLQITPDDFETLDDQWAPIPIERGDPDLESAIQAIDETLEKVLADNGYNVTFPEERNYIAEGLSSASKTLKQTTATSAPYLQKYVFEPLTLLIRRFKDAAIAVAASAAKEAIIEYLKKHGVEWIARLFS